MQTVIIHCSCFVKSYDASSTIHEVESCDVSWSKGGALERRSKGGAPERRSKGGSPERGSNNF
jgi:hypothetical protein